MLSKNCFPKTCQQKNDFECYSFKWLKQSIDFIKKNLFI